MPIIAKPLVVLAVVITLAALFSLPYGYYQLLRVFLCGLFAYSVVSSWKGVPDSLLWVMGAFAIIYNPLVPLHLGREIWIVVNLITVGLLGYLSTIKKTELRED